MAQKRKLDNYDDDYDAESLSSFESVEDLVHISFRSRGDRQTFFPRKGKSRAIVLFYRRFIPKDAVQVYTDGSRVEDRTGSGIFIRTPHLETTVKQSNPALSSGAS
ncbi:hypothetical protein TNCV_2672791 [Trichonephila clavipes]|nr:hypothetical protein TNCV_2672791 [Trichonephila clavipes]